MVPSQDWTILLVEPAYADAPFLRTDARTQASTAPASIRRAEAIRCSPSSDIQEKTAARGLFLRIPSLTHRIMTGRCLQSTPGVICVT